MTVIKKYGQVCQYRVARARHQSFTFLTREGSRAGPK
jgi:hypothetical protein